MKIDYDRIISGKLKESGIHGGEGMRPAYVEMMKTACEQVLDEAIKSFPSHEHPEITKSILALKNEL